MFQQQPAAGDEQRAAFPDQGADQRQTVGAVAERDFGFEAQIAVREVRVACGNIRGLLTIRSSRRPASGDSRSPCSSSTFSRPSRARFAAATPSAAALMSVPAHRHCRAFRGQRQDDAARPGADVGDARIVRQIQFKRPFNKMLCFGTRNQDGRVDPELTPVELTASGQVCDWHPFGAFVHQRIEALDVGVFDQARRRGRSARRAIAAAPARRSVRPRAGSPAPGPPGRVIRALFAGDLVAIDVAVDRCKITWFRQRQRGRIPLLHNPCHNPLQEPNPSAIRIGFDRGRIPLLQQKRRAAPACGILSYARGHPCRPAWHGPACAGIPASGRRRPDTASGSAPV